MADRRDIDERFETFEKPARAQRKGGKQKTNKDRMEHAPKEHYRRQRFSTRDVVEDDDE